MAEEQQKPRRTDTGELLDYVDKYASLIFANLMWVVLSLPIITMPAATAGLFAYMTERIRGKQPELIRVYFSGMRQYWRKATVIGVIDLIIAGLVILNLSIFSFMDSSGDIVAFIARSVTIFVALALVIVNFYLWPMLVLYEDPSLMTLLRNATGLVAAHLLLTIGMLFVVITIIGVSLMLPRGVFLFGTISLCAYFISMGAWRAIRQHIPKTSTLA